MTLEGKLSATVEVRIPYQDADPAGVAWHGNYFRYFDTARCALLDLFDYSYRSMEQSGYVWPIIDARVRFAQPIVYDQLILVTATLLESEYRLKIGYEIHNEAGQRLTKGHTIQVAVEMESGELCIGSPPALLDRLDTLAASMKL